MNYTKQVVGGYGVDLRAPSLPEKLRHSSVIDYTASVHACMLTLLSMVTPTLLPRHPHTTGFIFITCIIEWVLLSISMAAVVLFIYFKLSAS